MNRDAHNRPQPTRPLAVVIPLANEEATVRELLDRVLRQLGADDRIFCVLDNASQDRTRELVEQYGQRDGRVQLVWAPENRCVVDAYFAGYRAAYDNGAEWILEMDGGLSHQPEEIPRFTALLDHGLDYVAGCRFMRGGSHVGSFWRQCVSRGGGLLANLMLGTRMRDMTSGFEMFSRRAMAHVLARGVRSRANFFQTEIKYMLHDWKWTEVPIQYHCTKNSVPQGSIRESLRLLWQMRRQRKADR